MRAAFYLTLVLPVLVARGFLGSHGSNADAGQKVIDKSLINRRNELTNSWNKMFDRNVMDKSTVNEIRKIRAADISVSVDLDVKKENPGSKLRKKNKLKMKKMLRHQRFKQEKERMKKRRMAKAALKLSVALYKDVMPVVGAFAISSGEMMREKVIPAMKEFGEETSARAGRVASETMKTLREYAPLVRDTLESSMGHIMVGMSNAGAGVSAAAREFQSRYSSALAKIKEKHKEEKQKEFHRNRGPSHAIGPKIAVKITPR